VVQRRIMGCFRNKKGTGIYETVMTVLASWRQQGRDLSKTQGEALTQEWTKSYTCTIFVFINSNK